MPKTYAVPPPPHHNEGKTVAAWTMNLGIVGGAVLIALGMIIPSLMVLLWVGAGVVVVAIIIGIVLSVAGLGQPKGYGTPARTEPTAEADAR